VGEGFRLSCSGHSQLKNSELSRSKLLPSQSREGWYPFELTCELCHWVYAKLNEFCRVLAFLYVINTRISSSDSYLLFDVEAGMPQVKAGETEVRALG